MTEQPFHHGNLRAVLLAHAERTVREQGVDALSLRALAREAGVSHGAPRHHFPDRQALLHAVAERGFDRLTEAVRAAPAGDAASFEQSFHTVAMAYVEFAITDGALMELMFAMKNAAPPPDLSEAVEGFFTAVRDVITAGHRAGRLRLDDPYRLQILLVATLHGVATLVLTGRFPPDQVEDLVTDATALFIDPAR